MEIDPECGIPPQFNVEVYSKESLAKTRTERLNVEKPKYCGYWFAYDFATIDKKNEDWD